MYDVIIAGAGAAGKYSGPDIGRSGKTGTCAGKT